MASHPLDYFYRLIYRCRIAGYFLTARNRGDYTLMLLHMLKNKSLDSMAAIGLHTRLKKDINQEIYRKHIQLVLAKRHLNKFKHPVTQFLIQQYIKQSISTLKNYQKLKSWLRYNSTPANPNFYNPEKQPLILQLSQELLENNFLRGALIFLLYLTPCLALNEVFLQPSNSPLSIVCIIILTYCMTTFVYTIFKHRILKTAFINVNIRVKTQSR